MRPDANPEGEPLLVDAGRFRRRDRRRTAEGRAVVAENELAALDSRGILALLLERVLDLEQVGEVAGGVESDGQVDGLVFVVEDREFFVKTVADRAPADHRELRVDVDGPGAGDEEEARFEVLKVVDREWVHPLSVDAQDPLREEARVEREEARRIRQRRLDVPSLVADDERVAVEDLDEPVAHRLTPGRPFRRGGAGNNRWNSSTSPSE